MFCLTSRSSDFCQNGQFHRGIVTDCIVMIKCPLTFPTMGSVIHCWLHILCSGHHGFAAKASFPSSLSQPVIEYTRGIVRQARSCQMGDLGSKTPQSAWLRISQIALQYKAWSLSALPSPSHSKGSDIRTRVVLPASSGLPPFFIHRCPCPTPSATAPVTLACNSIFGSASPGGRPALPHTKDASSQIVIYLGLFIHI